MNDLEWNQHFDGEKWAVTDGGLVVVDLDVAREIAAETGYVVHTATIGCETVGYLRTRGTPLTMRTVEQDWGQSILKAGASYFVQPSLIATTIAREATLLKGTKYHRDAHCERYEERIDEYSAGLMQTLVSTANAMNRKHDLIDGVLDRFDLYSPEVSINLGAAYYEHGEGRIGTSDPVLLQAGYNAGWGSLSRASDKNRWKLIVHGAHAVEKFMAYNNDWLERWK